MREPQSCSSFDYWMAMPAQNMQIEWIFASRQGKQFSKVAALDACPANLPKPGAGPRIFVMLARGFGP
jgi:hypothetical protein